MIALLWLLVWELSLLPPAQDALPDRAVGLLYLALIVVGLGVGWYGVVGREINRVAWIITIGGFLASGGIGPAHAGRLDAVPVAGDSVGLGRTSATRRRGMGDWQGAERAGAGPGAPYPPATAAVSPAVGKWRIVL